MRTGVLSRGKATMAWRWSPPYSAEVTNEWSSTYTALFAFMTWTRKFLPFILRHNIRQGTRFFSAQKRSRPIRTSAVYWDNWTKGFAFTRKKNKMKLITTASFQKISFLPWRWKQQVIRLRSCPTRRHVPEDINLDTHRRENFKSCTSRNISNNSFRLKRRSNFLSCHL